MENLRIVATANPIAQLSKDFIQKGYRLLEKQGFKITESNNLYAIYGHTAGSISDRVNEFHNAIEDKNIDIIMSFWGGLQTHQILEFLDYEKIKQSRKYIIGYSDFSCLLVAIYSKTGLVTYLGPSVITFCKPDVPEYTLSHFLNSVTQFKYNQKENSEKNSIKIAPAQEFSNNRYWETPEKKMIFQNSSGWKIFNHGVSSGKIIAGNLGTLMLIYETEYFPSHILKDAILFIEEDECESSGTIDRLFIQMRHRGVFKLISALVIGRFAEGIFNSENDSFEMILNDSLAGYHFPVLYNVDFGHTDPLFTIPIGGTATIDTNKQEMTISL